jgi:glyoxylase-like metal-dependent hydrolase (beta-lactamase superfamily II)
VAGLDEAFAATGAVVRCHPVEVAAVAAQAGAVVPVADGETIALGDGLVEALYTPGHTPGCVCWYLPRPGAVITGDVLFVGSAGSVSLPDSDPLAMYHSLHRRLGALPEETRLYPGHDYGPSPTSTLAWEFASNPVLTAPSFEEFCRRKGVRLP